MEQALGLRAGTAARSRPPVRDADLDQKPDRPVRAGPARDRGPRTVAARPSGPRLIRRLTLDLTRPAAHARGGRRVSRRHQPDAYEALVDRLLASPHYGERMAMDWLDGARYADTNGFQNDFARTMWPWRDWVIAAFNRNQPFDRFVIEQIAGDLLPGASLDQRIATGFNRNNRTVTEAGSIDEEYRVENAVDRVETTSTVFLGLTLGCARCHDHKFDPISQAEFYQFFGFFNSVNEQGVYTETRGNVPPLIKLPTAEDHKHLGELEIAIAAAKVSGDKAWIEKTKKARDEYDKSITSVMVMEDRAKPRDTFVLKRGRYDMPDTQQEGRAGRSLVPAAVARGRRPQSAGPGAVAGFAGKPADGPRHRQPDLAAPFRHGPGQDGRELRHPGRAAVASRAARLAGERAGPHRLGLEGAAPADRHERDLPAGVDAQAGPGRSRPGKPAAGARTAVSAPGRSGARQCPGDRRLAGQHDRRPVDQAVPAGRPVGRAGRRRGRGALRARQGSDALRPQPLRLPQADGPAPGDGHLRRPQPRDLPGQAAANQHAAPGARALERRHLRRGRAATRAARARTGRLEPRGADHLRVPPGPRATADAARAGRICGAGWSGTARTFEADKDAALQLIRHGESPPDPKIDPVVLAAYTATASVILNLDETITLE